MKRLWMVALPLGLALATSASSATAADDAAVKRSMEEEMARSLGSLKLGKEGPPYYLRYTVSDSDRTLASAKLGALVEEDARKTRSMRVDARVGSAEEDNTNFSGASGGTSAGTTREDDVAALKRDLWQLTDREYKRALETLAHKRASRAVQAAEKDKVADFSKADALQSTTDHATPATDADVAKMKDYALRLSALFKAFPKVDGARVDAETAVVRRRLLTSEKTWTDERRSRVEITVRADAVAEDGQRLAASLHFSAPAVGALPAFAKMEGDVKELAKNLEAQRTAPTVEAGSAAVLFEDRAAPALARLLLAGPTSGQPVPRSAGESARDGSTSLAEKLGFTVAPKWLRVTDDPTALGPDKRLLFGGYDSDDEGVKAERVELIQDGVLKSLLMSRTPRKEIARSNGHGRAFGGIRAAASNLFVTASGGKDRAALLAAAARAAGPKGTVYVVKELGDASGIGRGQTLQVRVATRFKDGKEEPVRGLSLEGFVPKTLKKDLIAAGKEPFVLEDDDLGVPTSVVCPALLFEDVDVGKPNDKNRTPPLYPSPLALPKK